MRNIASFVIITMMVMPAMALVPAGQGRRTTQQQMMPAPRATASVNQLNAMASMASMKVPGGSQSNTGGGNGNNNNDGNTGGDGNTNNGDDNNGDTTNPSTPDMREKEKAACIGNNIGVGNTFVWASRYSNVNNYAQMIEDVEEPANNTCFVRVEMKSTDSKISVADIPAKYFEMGRTITCGAWADEKVLEKRILDAKKTARTWGTVGGVVGGAAVGVGAMELFGNRLIGGAVEGQKGLSESEQLRSQLIVMKRDKAQAVKYREIITMLQDLKDACENTDWTGGTKPAECNDPTVNYEYLLQVETMQ